jgi:dienelactone hydrolase
MYRFIAGFFAIALLFTWVDVLSAKPEISLQPVEYNVQGVLMKSYLAFDKNIKGQRPGVLVIPEWWGLNDYARKRAGMLAELGYTALGVDMYGEGKQAANPDEAAKLSSEVMKNIDGAEARFKAAMDILKNQPSVDPTRMAAIGYCFGGGVVLNMAYFGVDLRGMVSFHGGLTLAERAPSGGIKAKVLVLTGGDDPFVPPKQVEEFKSKMKAAGADLRVISYPGARHSFTNPEADALGKKFNMPIAYNASADQKSWQEMKTFLKNLFKK